MHIYRPSYRDGKPWFGSVRFRISQFGFGRFQFWRQFTWFRFHPVPVAAGSGSSRFIWRQRQKTEYRKQIKQLYIFRYNLFHVISLVPFEYYFNIIFILLYIIFILMYTYIMNMSILPQLSVSVLGPCFQVFCFLFKNFSNIFKK